MKPLAPRNPNLPDYVPARLRVELDTQWHWAAPPAADTQERVMPDAPGPVLHAVEGSLHKIIDWLLRIPTEP